MNKLNNGTHAANGTKGVLTFTKSTPGWSSSMGGTSEPTMHLSDTSYTNDGFLTRPVRIASYTWEQEEELDMYIDPWTEFMEDARVANRLAHFKNFRGSLSVEFQLSGNSFYYGRLLASYIPLYRVDGNSSVLPADRATLVQASQRPHVYLDPTESQGGELHLPFIWPKNAVSIPNKEWNQLGMIHLTTMNQLQHANGSRDPITVSVYANLVDYSLDSPTDNVFDVPSQAIPEAPSSDEYGVVSGPAHTIANWSGKLAKAPVIGPYARATQMVASTVGSVASLFGYSRPRQYETQLVQINNHADFANANTHDNVSSLALDAKKEITIDPRVVGAQAEDEMGIVPLACRESYLTSFPWSVEDTTNTHLFSIRITPRQFAENILQNRFMTPACWVGSLFEYWTGSMELRFQIVSSTHHRGRLRFVWDPDVYNKSGSDTLNFNSTISEIVDISESHDSTIRIGWGQDIPYLLFNGTNVPFSTEPFSTVAEGGANGVLSVYVVNELVSPSEFGRQVEVNVFTNMCDDFEVASPTGINLLDYEIVDVNSDNTIQNPGQVVDGVRPPTTPQFTQDDISTRTFTEVGFLQRGTDSQITLNDDGLLLANGGVPISLGIPYWNLTNTTIPVRLEFTAPANGISMEVILPDGTNVSVSFGGIGDTIPIDFIIQNPSTDGFAVDTVQITVNGPSRVLLNSYTVPALNDIEEVVLNVDQIASAVETGNFLLGSDPDSGLLQGDVVFNLPQQLLDGTPMMITTNSDLVINGQLRRVQGIAPAGSNTNVITFTGFSGRNTISANTPRSGGAATVGSLRYLSSVAFPEAEEGGEPVDAGNAPVDHTPQTHFGPECFCGPANQVYFGEQVASLRQMLKRYCTRYSVESNNAAGYQALILPQYPIPDLSAVDSTYVIKNHVTPMSWIAPAYLTLRGSTRYVVTTTEGGGGRPNLSNVYMSRMPLGNTTPLGSRVFTDQLDVVASFDGTAFSHHYSNGRSGVEVPYYSRYRFLPAKRIGTETIPFADDRIISVVSDWTSNNFAVALHTAIGEDFSLNHFLSTPTLLLR